MKKLLLNIYETLHRVYGPQHWWPARTRFEIIIGAILTQNTAWSNVEKAIANLRRERLLTPDGIKKTRKSKLARLIRPSGYYNVKTDRLKDFVNYFYSAYGGSLRRMFSCDTAKLRRELLGVKGLGRETADSILLYAGKRPVFVIDAYTTRVLSRHGIIRDNDDYDQIQSIFTENLPADYLLFNEYHALIVRLSKEACRKRPNCRACPIADLF